MTRYQARTFRTMIGNRLRERRLALGLTQEELAWEAGIAQGSISHYEQGKNEVPLAVLISICRALKVSPLQIVPGLEPTEWGNEEPVAGAVGPVGAETVQSVGSHDAEPIARVRR